MKFEKFLKSLGGHGIIYTKGDERWLASSKVCAKIPETMVGVIAENIVEMPETIRKHIDCDMCNDPCELKKAIMPVADGGIKDCVRVFATENGVELALDNDEYSFVSNSDIVEIHTKFESDTESYTGVALIVREINRNPDEDPEIIGIIYPTTTEYKNKEEQK